MRPSLWFEISHVLKPPKWRPRRPPGSREKKACSIDRTLSIGLLLTGLAGLALVPVPLANCGVFVTTVSVLLPVDCFLRIHRISGTADVGFGGASSGGPTKSSNSCGKFAWPRSMWVLNGQVWSESIIIEHLYCHNISLDAWTVEVSQHNFISF